MKTSRRMRIILIFVVSLCLIAAMLAASVVMNHAYNSKWHLATFEGPALFAPEEQAEVSVVGVARGSTWTKVFDFHNEGLTEHNYQAFTYDFTVANNTRNQVEDFSFVLTFRRDVYLMSGWNGVLEIHQFTAGDEIVDTIQDLREYDPAAHSLNYVVFDGEPLVVMHDGDYMVYRPSKTMNAREVPIEPFEATTPGFILYVAIGETIEDSSLALTYRFHRLLRDEPLFRIALSLLAVWIVARIVSIIISIQIRKYQARHERDNEIINESIETFTGFIDAKDPYTNGHSKRVAIYTKMIAREMGYEGEELDRIYYIALLHDCGKIGVPDDILTKPGKLTDEEFAVLKSHPQRGSEILRSFKSLPDVDKGAHYHHERYDGHGYPEGLAGEDIPLVARMICVADSFDAMATNRVYRKKLPMETIISEIETNKGRQFDPNIADIMLRLIREGKVPVEL